MDDRPPLDRAAHLRRDLDFLEARLDDAQSLLIPVWRDQTLVRAERLVVASVGDDVELVRRADEVVFLGMFGARACFAVDVSGLDAPLRHPALAGESVDLRMVGARLSPGDAGLAAYARALLFWHRRHRFCGACGAETRPRAAGHLRVCARGDCGTEHFPRTDPAVLVLVHDGDRCLVGRQRAWPRGMYSALAGFVEPGESLEDAVAREVLEEAGVHVADIRYEQSQPWPFPASLMLGFTARATTRELALDGHELEDARWVTPGEILAPPSERFFVPDPFSLAGRMLRRFATAAA
jgi:NAD+ diphosphatase